MIKSIKDYSRSNRQDRQKAGVKIVAGVLTNDEKSLAAGLISLIFSAIQYSKADKGLVTELVNDVHNGDITISELQVSMKDYKSQPQILQSIKLALRILTRSGSKLAK